MACILKVNSEEKISISGNCCPECNVPATRHQAIYSPDFDKLVSIYQGLELGLACLRPCCRETYKDFKEQEQGGTMKKVKRKHRQEKNNVNSLHQMSEGVLKKDAVGSSNQIPESVVEGNEGATVVSPNQRLECGEERGEEAGVVFANQMRPVEGEKKATVASSPTKKEKLPSVEGEKKATVASSQKKRVKKRRKLARDDVTFLHQRSERDNETFVGSLNQRPESLVKGNEGAALVSSNLRSECVVEGEEKVAVASLIERLPCVQGGEKEASVASMNQLLPCAVEGQKEGSVFLNQKSAEGEKEAAVGSLNQRLTCAAEGEREAFVTSSTARSACVEEGGKEASVCCVEVPMNCASKKKKKRKRVVSYKGHPTMSKRVQLPSPLLEGSEEQKKTASLLQKTCPMETEVLQENADASKEGLSVVLSGTLHQIDELETAVTKTVADRLCLPCEDAKGNFVIGNVIGVMAQHDRTKSISTSNYVISGNDSGKQPPKSQMELDLNSEALAECKPKQNILVLDELSCVFCQAPLNSQVAGPMMHYARGVPVQAGTRIKSLVSVHQHCAEWAPNVYYVGDNAKNLGKEVARGQKLKCNLCGLKGAVLGCLVKRCIKSYHYPCARSLSCRWDPDNYVVLCPDHVAENLPCDKSTNVKNKLKATSGKLPESAPCGRNNTPENKAMVTRERKAEKHAADDTIPSCMNTARNSSGTWASKVGCELVICGSGLDSTLHELLASFAMQTGARLTKTWDSQVTHLIIATDQAGAAARTLKFMFATLSGIWILKPDWLKACVAAYQLVGEEAYEVNLDIHRMVGGPRRARLLAASRSHKLLENIEFYFLGDYAAAYKMDLQALVSAAGGRIEDDRWNADEMQTRTRIVVYNANRTPAVAGPEAIKNRRSQAKTVAHKARAHVVAHTWILDTIAAYELQPFY